MLDIKIISFSIVQIQIILSLKQYAVPAPTLLGAARACPHKCASWYTGMFGRIVWYTVMLGADI